MRFYGIISQRNHTALERRSGIDYDPEPKQTAGGLVKRDSRKVRETLKAAGIPYDMKTVQNHTALGKAIHAGAGVGAYRGGMPASSFSDQISYVYIIYVRRKDLDKAKQLCHIA